MVMSAKPMNDEGAVSVRKSIFPDAIRRRAPVLMFALGVATTVIATNGWQVLSRQTEGVAATAPDHRIELADSAKSSNAQPIIVLSGVNGEAFAEGELQVVSAKSGRAFEQTSFASAEINLPKKLQVGDILTLTANSGAVFSFKVARLAALCSADPSHQPVPDVALVECAERGRAEQWRYVIEAVTEPTRDGRHTGAPRSL